MADRAGFSSMLLRRLLDGAQQLGVDVPSVLDRVGLSGRALSDPDEFVPVTVADALWTACAESSGDPCFGLHVTQHFPPVGALEFAALASETVGDGLRCFVRYYALMSHASGYRLDADPDEARLIITRTRLSPTSFFHHASALFGYVISRLRLATWGQVSPREIRFEHAAPSAASVAEYERVLQAPLRFGASATAIVLAASDLGRSLYAADPSLRRALESWSGAPRPDDETLAARVRALLPTLLPGNEKLLPAVARRLGVSPRTMQRQLQRESTSFAQLVDEARRQLAMSRLAHESSLTVTELAFLTGFTRPGGFHRAFKRWTGVTPAEFRRQPS